MTNSNISLGFDRFRNWKYLNSRSAQRRRRRLGALGGIHLQQQQQPNRLTCHRNHKLTVLWLGGWLVVELREVLRGNCYVVLHAHGAGWWRYLPVEWIGQYTLLYTQRNYVRVIIGIVENLDCLLISLHLQNNDSMHLK